MGILIIMTKTRVVNPFFENVFVFLRFFSKMYEKTSIFRKKMRRCLSFFALLALHEKGMAVFRSRR